MSCAQQSAKPDSHELHLSHTGCHCDSMSHCVKHWNIRLLLFTDSVS